MAHDSLLSKAPPARPAGAWVVFEYLTRLALFQACVKILADKGAFQARTGSFDEGERRASAGWQMRGRRHDLRCYWAFFWCPELVIVTLISWETPLSRMFAGYPVPSGRDAILTSSVTASLGSVR